MGYHSRVYYQHLQPPPVGAYFDRQWGLAWNAANATKGEWLELPFEVVSTAIEVAAGSPDCASLESAYEAEMASWERGRQVVRSILTRLLKVVEDTSLSDALDGIIEMRPRTKSEIVQALLDDAPAHTLDARASSEGPCVPPHVACRARLAQLTAPSALSEQLGSVARQVVEQLEHTSRSPAP